MNSETMRTEDEMISVEEAAEILNVSLSHLVELTKSGELNVVEIEGSVCLRSAEVRRYKGVWMKQQKAALDELAKLSQELRLGY